MKKLGVINWTISPTDQRLITQIARRAVPLYARFGESQTVADMDLTACHANGCPLDLPALLNAPQTDFTHDVTGIRKFINRETGQLEGSFHPRFALSQ